MALPGTQDRIRAHAGSHLLACGARDDTSVGAGGFDNLHIGVKLRDRLGVAVDALEIVDGLGADAEDHLRAIGEPGGVGA